MTHCDHCGKSVPLSEGPHYGPKGLACLECFRALVRAANIKRILSHPPKSRRAV